MKAIFFSRYFHLRSSSEQGRAALSSNDKHNKLNLRDLSSNSIIHTFLHLTVSLKISERPLFINCMCTGHTCFCLSTNCSSLSGIRENVLQFLRIQMANCTRRPALSDEWQKQKKKHISSMAQLTSQLHTDSSCKCAK